MSASRKSLLSAALPTLACTVAALSFSVLAAPAAPDQGSAAAMHQEGPGAGYPVPMLFQPPGRLPPHEPGFCRGGELFCAAVQTDNPADTLQKLNGILPAANGGHYRVRVSVERVPEHPMDKGPHPAADTPPASAG
ncbi:hypothetical protein [Sodalis sp. C49]|uniref:hypothetical protein n=1 Tax=Sodalis sp. C49 TaxID=3228929 RepID=UPI003965A83E